MKMINFGISLNISMTAFAPEVDIKIMQFKKYFLLLVCLFYSSSYATDLGNTLSANRLSLIVYESQTQSTSSSGGSSSSNTSSAILERRISKRDGGLELEYSFPQSDISEIDAWILPAQVFVIPGSSIELLNEPEINARLNRFLDKHPEIRKVCGEVIFTWTTFEIHCDTNHAIDVIKSYNLHLGPLHEGKLYEEPGTLAYAPLKRVSVDGNNLIYQAEFVLDPQHLQTEYEKSMKQVAKITGESESSVINSSLKLTGNEKPKFSGTRLVTIEAEPSGLIVRIMRETTTIINGGGTFRETTSQNETLKRQEAE